MELGIAFAEEERAKIAQEQPGDRSFEEILRELAFVRMIDRGLPDSEVGNVISDQETSRRIKLWRK